MDRSRRWQRPNEQVRLRNNRHISIAQLLLCASSPYARRWLPDAGAAAAVADPAAGFPLEFHRPAARGEDGQALGAARLHAGLRHGRQGLRAAQGHCRVAGGRGARHPGQQLGLQAGGVMSKRLPLISTMSAQGGVRVNLHDKPAALNMLAKLPAHLFVPARVNVGSAYSRRWRMMSVMLRWANVSRTWPKRRR